MLLGLLIIPRTISTNPLARLLLIVCWRCIAFLILRDMERKGRVFDVERDIIIMSCGFMHIKKRGDGLQVICTAWSRD